MELTSAAIIKELLQKYSKRPSKSMGQNFLIDKSVLANIIKTANIEPGDTVLEIGPGIGTLTQELAKKAARVITVEKDPMMVAILQETLVGFSNVKVLQEDILSAKLELPEKYNVVANVPYYITSPIIRLFLEAKHQPQEMVLMVQKEVAQRICATPPDMSILAVSVQFYAKTNIIATVSKGCFWPVPNVDSAIIVITPTPTKNVDTAKFFKIIKAGFAHPRKQLAGNLTEGLGMQKTDVETWLLQHNIKPNQRAETLSLQDWLNLANTDTF